MEVREDGARRDCPFSHGSCTECAIYRGRHRDVVLCTRTREKKSGPTDPIANYFKALEELLNPWEGAGDDGMKKPAVRLKVVDAESGDARLCEIEETKTWDWGNPEKMRIIGDRQVISFNNLIDVLTYKAEQGHQEVKLYEFPRFMFLAGG